MLIIIEHITLGSDMNNENNVKKLDALLEKQMKDIGEHTANFTAESSLMYEHCLRYVESYEDLLAATREASATKEALERLTSNFCIACGHKFYKE